MQTVIRPRYDPGIVYHIPVVFHTITDSSGAGFVPERLIRSQIAVLNEDFTAAPNTPGSRGRNSGIQFYLAQRDPAGNPTSGITRTANDQWFRDRGSYKSALAWDPERYLNIYTVEFADPNTLGYATLPQSQDAGTTDDGIVILWNIVGRFAPAGPPYDRGRSMTHEIGHYLGLLHTFEGCGAADCYAWGDLICDTAPSRFPNYRCQQTSSCQSPDPLNNFMNYTDDICMWEFTAEQINRMRCSLENYRPLLAMRTVAAGVATRGGGRNPRSYSASPPILGSTMDFAIDLTTTGHGIAAVLGYDRPASLSLGGYTLLVDALGGIELLGLPLAAGPVGRLSLPIPNISTLIGFRIYTQAVHLLGTPEFALSNSQDLTFGTGADLWVDFAYRGPELGTVERPYSTISNALNYVPPGGTLSIVPGTSAETPTISQPMTLRAAGGHVTIGR